MPVAYVTFSTAHKHQLRDKLITHETAVQISAPTDAEIRALVCRNFKTSFSQVIREEDWKYNLDYFPRGVIELRPDDRAIPLTPETFTSGNQWQEWIK